MDLTADLTTVSDHELLAGGLWDQATENRAAARRLERMDEFRRRREADYRARQAEDPHFTLTPLQETVIEAGELYGMGPGGVASQLGIGTEQTVGDRPCRPEGLDRVS